MSERDEYQPGVPCWVDILVSDPVPRRRAAKAAVVPAKSRTTSAISPAASAILCRQPLVIPDLVGHGEAREGCRGWQGSHHSGLGDRTHT